MNDVEVAIVGAGPYGLSLASHLRAAGVTFRQFGPLMNPWRTAMPQGMFLKSQGFASSLSRIRGARIQARGVLRRHRASLRQLRAAGAAGHVRGIRGVVPGRTAARAGADARHRRQPPGHRLPPRTGHRRGGPRQPGRGRRRDRALPVRALGAGRPPEEFCTHSSQHTDLAAWRGRSVIILGAGQLALESAALLHEQEPMSGSSCASHG